MERKRRILSIDQFVAEDKRIDAELDSLVELAILETEKTEDYRNTYKEILEKNFDVEKTEDLSFEQKRRYLNLVKEELNIGDNLNEALFEGSALRDEYKKYFNEKLEEMGAKSVSELDKEKKSEFFKKIKEGWEKGKGRKVSESALNESKSINDWVKELNNVDFVYDVKKKGKKIFFTMDVDVETGEDYQEDTIDCVIEFDPKSDTLYLGTADGDSEADVTFNDMESDLLAFGSGVVRYANENKQVNEDHIAIGTELPDGGSVDSWNDTRNVYIVLYNDGSTVEMTGDEIDKILNESRKVKINEKEIKTDDEFKEWAETKLKAMHGDDFDEDTATETIDGLLKKKEDDDLDYGAIVGMLNKA